MVSKVKRAMNTHADINTGVTNGTMDSRRERKRKTGARISTMLLRDTRRPAARLHAPLIIICACQQIQARSEGWRCACFVLTQNNTPHYLSCMHLINKTTSCIVTYDSVNLIQKTPKYIFTYDAIKKENHFKYIHIPLNKYY